MTTVEIPPTGTPMTWEEFDALGEMRWTEYIDGRIVIPDNPDRIHQGAVIAVANLLEAALRPGFHVTHQWSWKPGRDEFVPDVTVHARTREDVRYLGTPALCVEVMGYVSATWNHDLVLKTAKYAAYGLDRYWVLDLRKREMYVFARQGLTYELVLTVGEEPVEIDFGAGRARVDLAAIIGRRLGLSAPPASVLDQGISSGRGVT